MYYDPNFLGTRRRVGADGLIEIKCRICEKTICREMYRGFSTAICAVCQGQIEAGKRPEDIINDVRMREEKARDEVYDDIGPGGFKVSGIGQRMKDVIKEVKEVAQKRRRSPIFAKKDKVPK